MIHQTELTDPHFAPADPAEPLVSTDPAVPTAGHPRRKKWNYFQIEPELLLKEAELILNAARKHSAEITRRLGGTVVAEAARKWTALAARSKEVESDVVTTLNQNRAAMADIFSQLKATARRAFKGQKEKLIREFKTGIDRQYTLSHDIERARVVCAWCALPENAAALASQGWIAEDTAAFSAAIEGVVRDAQRRAQRSAQLYDLRTAIYALSNGLYEDLRTIQNAANIQWPVRFTANEAVRAKFRLEVFPSKMREEAKKAQAPAK